MSSSVKPAVKASPYQGLPNERCAERSHIYQGLHRLSGHWSQGRLGQKLLPMHMRPRMQRCHSQRVVGRLGWWCRHHKTLGSWRKSHLLGLGPHVSLGILPGRARPA